MATAEAPVNDAASLAATDPLIRALRTFSRKGRRA